MTKKNTQISDEAKFDSKVYDRTFESELGKVRVVVDIFQIQEDMEKYAMALANARNLPPEPTAIAPDDPVVDRMMDTYPDLQNNSEDLYQACVAYYTNEMQQAQRDAAILACITHEDNVFNNIPEPYSDQIRKLPGLYELPPARDLTNRIERRYKQALDILVRDPNVYRDFQREFAQISVKIATQIRGLQQQDKNGFQS